MLFEEGKDSPNNTSLWTSPRNRIVANKQSEEHTASFSLISSGDKRALKKNTNFVDKIIYHDIPTVNKFKQAFRDGAKKPHKENKLLLSMGRSYAYSGRNGMTIKPFGQKGGRTAELQEKVFRKEDIKK